MVNLRGGREPEHSAENKLWILICILKGVPRPKSKGLCCYDLVLRCPHKDQVPSLVLPGWWLKLQEVGQLRSFQLWGHALEGDVGIQHLPFLSVWLRGGDQLCFSTPLLPCCFTTDPTTTGLGLKR